MNLWFRAYGIPFSALRANLTMIPKGVTLRVSLNFNALVGRASASKSRCIMSAVGTTLLQSPGCNEGKARYETLGRHEPKVISSSGGAALTTRALKHLLLGCAAPTGLNKYVSIINPGLVPWAMQEYRPYRASLRLLNQIYFIIVMRLPWLKVNLPMNLY